MAAALPLPSNTTCDIYHFGNSPPANPDVPGVKCTLQERYRNIKQAPAALVPYTHMMYVPRDTDIRDGYNGGNPDRVYVPDKNGTLYLVQFVARVARGTQSDCKVLYLNRNTITWPTDNV
jgi:hypothetical protein